MSYFKKQYSSDDYVNEKYSKENKSEKDMLRWIYREGKWNFWFVDMQDLDWNKKWYYVFSSNRWEALTEDEVLFSVRIFKWREEALIEKVIKRADKIWTWTFQELKDAWTKKRKWFGFVIIDNPYFKSDVFIAWKEIDWLVEWDKLAIKIIKWSGKNPEWKVVEKIWARWEKYVDIMAMAYEWWAKLNFPQNILNVLKSIPKWVLEKDFKWRKDCRDLFVFTIDPDDSKDFDDAISIEKLKNWNFKLYVHIADVTYYIKEWTALDLEAKSRWTSIYFVDRVVPMLPEILSNELCSLNPFEDKLAMTCEMEINPKWEVLFCDVYESVINSNFRLTYKNAEDIKNMWFKDWSIENLLIKNSKYTQDFAIELFEKLKLSYELKDILYNYKKANWYIEFDLVETKIVVDEKWYPIELKKYPKYEANKLVEFFMILANESVAKKFSNLPFLYRVHPDPDEKDIVRLKYALKYIWVDYSDRLAEVVEKLKWRPEEGFISKLILKTMNRAIYSTENNWHYGLRLDYYSHFTSPIRRYSDLQIHRIIREKLHNEMTKSRIEHYEKLLPEVANICSEQERQAEDIEHKIDDYLQTRFMLDKIWEEFDWIISWVIERWFFVQLENTVEWFVELSSWKQKLWRKKWWNKWKESLDFDDMLLEIKNNSTWEKYRLGDSVKVRVSKVDEVFSRIDFELIAKI